MTIVLFLALIGGAVSPWFALTVGDAGKNCVFVRRVQPDGPAGMAGLRDGDCVVRVHRTAVHTTKELLEQLRRADAHKPISLILSDGRALVTRPAARSAEGEAEYCEYLNSVETSVRVFIAPEDGVKRLIELSFPRRTTLAEIRKLSGAQGVARVVQAQCAGPDADQIVDEPAESIVVNNGSSVYFGYDNIDAFAIGRKPKSHSGEDPAVANPAGADPARRH